MRGEFLYDVGTTIYAIGLLAGLIFSVHYMTTAPWWTSAVGRMFAMIGLALVVAGVTVIVQIMLQPEGIWRLVFRLAGYGFFSLAMGFLLGTYLRERLRVGVSILPLPPKRKKGIMNNAPTPEPIWYPAQRVIRTILAALVVLVPVLNASLPLVASAFDAEGVPANVYLVVNAIIGACLVVLGVLTRIMAIPAVNEFLTRIGAGSVPVKAIAPNGTITNPANLR